MGLGERSFGGNRYLSDKGVHEKAEVRNNGICSREDNIRNFYRSREDVGFQ